MRQRNEQIFQGCWYTSKLVPRLVSHAKQLVCSGNPQLHCAQHDLCQLFMENAHVMCEAPHCSLLELRAASHLLPFKRPLLVSPSAAALGAKRVLSVYLIPSADSPGETRIILSRGGIWQCWVGCWYHTTLI